MEFVVFRKKMTDAQGVPLMLGHREAVPESLSRMYFGVIEQAWHDMDRVAEFLFSFLRESLNLPKTHEEIEPLFLRERTYRVSVVPTAGGRGFFLRPWDSDQAPHELAIAELPEGLKTDVIERGEHSGLLILTGPPRSGRTRFGIALARHIASRRKVQLFLQEASPQYLYAEPWVHHIANDNPRQALDGIMGIAREQPRILFIDDPIERQLAFSALNLARHNFLVIVTMIAEPGKPSSAIETMSYRAGLDSEGLDAITASATLGVIQMPTRMGLGAEYEWYPLTSGIRELVAQGNYPAADQLLHERRVQGDSPPITNVVKMLRGADSSGLNSPQDR